MNQGNFALDRLSFWLGFLAASLFAFLAYRFRKYWPEISKYIRERFNYYKQLRQAGVEAILRKETLKRSQSSHLAAQLFALDEVVIEPYLLAPPPQRTSDEEYHPRKYFPQAISYLPDAPDFAGQYGAVRLTLVESLAMGAKIAIVGVPGSGKTTALAYLASKIVRHDPSSAALNEFFPIFIHIADIQLSTDKQDDPIDKLIKAVQFHIPANSAAQCDEFIHKSIETKSILVLLDGIDELSPPEFDKAFSYVYSLLKMCPDLMLMISATPEQSLRLLEIDIEPVAISGWNRKEIRDFVKIWCQAWNNNLGAEIESQTRVKTVDPLILSGMLCNDPLFHTPAEWMMKSWAVCAGNLKGSNSAAAVKAHVDRRLDATAIHVASALAGEMLSKHNSTLSISDAEKIAADHSQNFIDGKDSRPDKQSTVDTTTPPPQQNKATTQQSGKSILGGLESKGFVRRHLGDRLAFSNPLFCGYFASRMENPAIDDLNPNIDWSAQHAYLNYTIASKTPTWLADFLKEENSPILGSSALAAGWLRFLPVNSPAKTYLMRYLIQKINNDKTSWNIRQKLSAQIASCNDPSVNLLFKQWLSSPRSELRVIAILGLGINQQTKLITDIAACLNDPTAEVRYATCFALSTINSSEAQKVLCDALEMHDEPVKMAAAEALAIQGVSGREKLEQFYTSDDILIRRVAIFGISQIPDSWVEPFLEKVCTEDSQWVVRTAAGEALEHRKLPSPHIPKQPVEPANAGWLIKFASRSGSSVSIQESPVPLLLEALTNGDPEEQYAALWMMRKYQDPKLIKQVAQLLNHESIDVREAAAYILWQLLPPSATLQFN